MFTNLEATRHKFRNDTDEFVYRCNNAALLLHERGGRARARRHIERLRQLLPGRRHHTMAITRQTALALVAEYDGHWGRAIRHRRREAELVIWLYDELRSNTRDERRYALQGGFRKHRVLMRLRAAKRYYERRGGAEVARALDAVMELIAEARQPAV